MTLLIFPVHIGIILLHMAAISSVTSIFITAGIAVFASVTAPLLLLYLSGQQRIRDKELDWKRQDEVAARAEAATAAVAVTAQTAQANAQKAAEGAALIASQQTEFSTRTNAKLDVIHTLVNNNLTVAMQAQLDSSIAELRVRKELAAKGVNDPDWVVIIQGLEDKIVDLTLAIADRHAQATEANKLKQEHPQAEVAADSPEYPGGGGPYEHV